MSELVTMTDTNMNASQDHDPVLNSSQRPSMDAVDTQLPKKGPMRYFLPFVIVAIVAGIGTGYVLSNKLTLSAKKTTSGTEQTATTTSDTEIVVDQVYGSKDASTFKDSAEGVLVAGGASGEGSHHIVREGGESQNVYLTSSLVDLQMFEGHRVMVRGETFTAQRAGWLMDVGQIKVEELNAPLPAWAQKAAEEAAAGEED